MLKIISHKNLIKEKKEIKMTELAEFIFEKMGTMILNKKQVAKLIGKSVPFVDAAIHQNRLEKLPKFTKNTGGAIEFAIIDVADFLEQKTQKKA